MEGLLKRRCKRLTARLGLVNAARQQERQQPRSALGGQLHFPNPFFSSTRRLQMQASPFRGGEWNSQQEFRATVCFDCTSTLPWCN